jgi:hypothetical protein
MSITRRSLFGLALAPLALIAPNGLSKPKDFHDLLRERGFDEQTIKMLIGHDIGVWQPCTIVWSNPLRDEKFNSYFTKLVWKKWYPLHDRRHTSL